MQYNKSKYKYCKWKQNWLKKQSERRKDNDAENISNSFQKNGWIKYGLFMGAFSFISMSLLWPLALGDEIRQKSVLIAIPFWLLTGLGYGFTMKLIYRKKKAKS